jgi:hypothetical protein
MDLLDLWGEVGNYIQQAGNEGAASFNRGAGAAGAEMARPVAEWMQEHPRVMGAVKALGGAAEAAVGAGLIAAPEPTMATKVLGAATCAHGADTFMAGLNQMIDGENKRTLTSRGLESVARVAGAENPELIGELGDAGIGIALTAGSGLAINSMTKGSKALAATTAASESAMAADEAQIATSRLNAINEVNGKCPCVDIAKTTPSLDELSKAASVADRGGLTAAGRSLTKHGAGARSGNSPFPAAKGNPATINQTAQNVVDDILTTPGSTIQNGNRGRFGPTLEVTAPDGRGIVYDANGKFLFFKQ